MWWGVIHRTASIAGILGLALSIYIFFAVKDTKNLLENFDDFKTLSVELTTPSGDIQSHLFSFSGLLEFEPYRPSKITSVRLLALQNNLELVAMVRPQAEPLRWWPQPPPALADNGGFSGTARLGEAGGIAGTLQFELVVLVAPAGSIIYRETYESLPTHYAQSNLLRITRQH